jgi:hypothetical protein
VQKKRHHYVPVTYLKGFTDNNGFLLVSRKDEPERSIRVRPTEAGFRNYYYSQPLGDGTMNHNALEDVFSTFENEWPGLVGVLESDRQLNTILKDLLGLIGFQRIRVPAFRDAIEHSLERYARDGLQELKRTGRLPPTPPEFPDLFEQVEVTIDPHQSIHGMNKLLRSLGPTLDAFGYQVVHNETDIDFITSDNPVSYYALSQKQILPYPMSVRGPAELVFPVSSRVAIFGSTADRRRFSRKGLKSCRTRDRERVRSINRVTAKFGYEALFSSSALPASFVQKYSASPVLSPDSAGFHPDDMKMPSFAFGRRKRLPKWKS